MKLKKAYNRRQLLVKQRRFLHALEGIGDVLVFETRRRSSNERVRRGLERLQRIAEYFLVMRQDDPDKFERLLLTEDFLELYRKNEEEAKLRLAFDPTKYLVTFATVVNQILRIQHVAMEAENHEISKLATYHLNWLVGYLSQTENNELLIEQVLEKLGAITWAAIKKQDPAMYAASIHWYVDIVFDTFGQSGGQFQLSYLDLFDRYFFSSVRQIVARQQTSLYQALVSALVDVVDIPSHHEGKIWDYGHLILHGDIEKYSKLNDKHQLERRIRELAASQKELDTKQKLDSWLERFSELKKILDENFTHDQRKRANELERDIRDFSACQLKYMNLLEIVFAVGAYCVFKRRANYIRYLWEYKQPPDSEAHWIGHDIVPVNIDEVMTLYWRKGLFDRRFAFWEGHHGSALYFKKYFLLLLARVLRVSPQNSGAGYDVVGSYNLPALPVHRLSEIQESAGQFIELAKELKVDTDFLASLGFDPAALDETFDKKLITFLHSLQLKAQGAIKQLELDEPVSSKKVREFTDDVVRGFNDSVMLRHIFKLYRLYKDSKADAPATAADEIALDVVTDKAAFFEQWHIDYFKMGLHFGQDLARREDSHLLSLIAGYCRPVGGTDLRTFLTEIHEPANTLVLAAPLSVYDFFHKQDQFRHKSVRESPEQQVPGFLGWYLVGDHHIPVFRLRQMDDGPGLLILNKTKMGTLVQYSPLPNGRSGDDIADIFHFSVLTISEDAALMNQWLQQPPKWLQSVGDEDARRDHLKRKSRVRISERLRFNKHEDFEGYVIKAKKE